MELVAVILVAAAASICSSHPNDYDDILVLDPPYEDESISVSVRAVANPKTPNQILDALAEGATRKLKDLKWDLRKKIRDGRAEIPFKVNAGGSSKEDLVITGGYITGLGSLTRSKSASFNKDKSQLTGTLVVKDACAVADYRVVFDGVGEAPAQSVQGRVTECSKLFADIGVRISNLIPQNIRTYSVRSGHDSLQISNMMGNRMKNVHEAGIRKALRELLKKTMATNVKVQLNQAIREIKKASN